MRTLLVLVAMLATLCAQVERVMIATPSGDSAANAGERIELRHPGVMLTVTDTGFDLWHPGNPRDYQSGREVEAVPYQFTSIRVVVSGGWLPLGYPLNKAVPREGYNPGTVIWEVVGDEQARIPDPRYADVEGLDRQHWIAGGSRLNYTFRPAEAYLYTLPSPERFADAWRRCGVSHEGLGHPRIRQALELHTGDPTSWDVRGSGNLLSRMIPSVVEARFGGTWNVDGWYHAGDVVWASGHSNLHYNGGLWPLLYASEHRDTPEGLFAYTLGMWMLRQKASLGIVWSPQSRWNGMQHYEKGIPRRGSYTWPATFKQWQLPFEVASALEPGDALLAEARDAGRRWWLRKTPGEAAQLYTGQWGERIPGWMMRNLAACYVFDEDVAHRAHYKAMADALLQVCFRYAAWDGGGGRNLWFHDSSKFTTKTVKPWMECIALDAAWWWMREHGLAAEHMDLFRDCVQHLFDVGTAPSSDGGWYVQYELSGYPERAVRLEGAPVHTTHAVRLLKVGAALGIESVQGVPFAEFSRRIRSIGLDAAGLTRSQVGTIPDGRIQAPNRMDYLSGVNGGMGPAACKDWNKILCQVLVWDPPM